MSGKVGNQLVSHALYIVMPGGHYAKFHVFFVQKYSGCTTNFSLNALHSLHKCIPLGGMYRHGALNALHQRSLLRETSLDFQIQHDFSGMSPLPACFGMEDCLIQQGWTFCKDIT